MLLDDQWLTRLIAELEAERDDARRTAVVAVAECERLDRDIATQQMLDAGRSDEAAKAQSLIERYAEQARDAEQACSVSVGAERRLREVRDLREKMRSMAEVIEAARTQAAACSCECGSCLRLNDAIRRLRGTNG
jgi:hypothetical protein